MPVGGLQCDCNRVVCVGGLGCECSRVVVVSGIWHVHSTFWGFTKYEVDIFTRPEKRVGAGER